MSGKVNMILAGCILVMVLGLLGSKLNREYRGKLDAIYETVEHTHELLHEIRLNQDTIKSQQETIFKVLSN